MFILSTPKKLRKHLRTKIKQVNHKKVMIDELSIKEYKEALNYVV